MVAVKRIVILVDEDDVAVIAALNDMLRIARQGETGVSSHIRTSMYRVA
jgi:hypothetical protein